LKIFGVTVETARFGLASRIRALNSVMNVRILRTLRALGMKDFARAAREGERILGKRSCESKQVMLTIGLRSRI